MTINFELLDTLNLSRGCHINRETGVSVMEAAAWVTGEAHNEYPSCVCPIIRTFMSLWDFALPTDADRNRLFKPFMVNHLTLYH